MNARDTMADGHEALTQGRIARFWLPLQLTWLMMAVEMPLLTAIIARLDAPKFNLAAFGVTYSLAIMVEAPVIMLMSASTALVDSDVNYRRLRDFMWLLNGGITAVMLALLLTPLWGLAIHDWMELDAEVARLAHGALLIMLPWPAAIGYRRFYQGLLIRTGRTRLVAVGTVARLVTMALTAVLLWFCSEMPGAWVGAWALSLGVIAEAAAVRLMSGAAIAELRARPCERCLGYGEMARFYYPLALTSTISLVVHPAVTFFLGTSRNAIESLAVLPVINALVFLFRTPGLSFQEVAIAMVGRDWTRLPAIRRFAGWLGLAASAALALIALTPLSAVWFQDVSGLSPELARFALLPTRILVLMPALSVLLSFQRSTQVILRRTSPVTWASVLEVAGILVVLHLTLREADWSGATAAAFALMVGRVASNLYLLPGLWARNPEDR